MLEDRSQRGDALAFGEQLFEDAALDGGFCTRLDRFPGQSARFELWGDRKTSMGKRRERMASRRAFSCAPILLEGGPSRGSRGPIILNDP